MPFFALSMVAAVAVAASPVSGAWLAIEADHFGFRVNAMRVLLGWAVLNMVVGVVGAAVTKNRAIRVFFGANAAWNLVNFAIAAGGAWSAAIHAPGTLSGAPLVQEMAFFQDVLLVNAGLDVGYAGVGSVTYLWGREKGDIFRAPIGLALILQGLFLLGFDITLSMMVGSQLEGAWAILG